MFSMQMNSDQVVKFPVRAGRRHRSSRREMRTRHRDVVSATASRLTPSRILPKCCVVSLEFDRACQSGSMVHRVTWIRRVVERHGIQTVVM